MSSDNNLPNIASDAMQLIAAAFVLAAREGGDLPEISAVDGFVDGGDGGDVGDGVSGGGGGNVDE